jgi:hypothetical protein
MLHYEKKVDANRFAARSSKKGSESRYIIKCGKGYFVSSSDFCDDWEKVVSRYFKGKKVDIMKPSPLLTIMIPTTVDRRELFNALIVELNRQVRAFCEDWEVEIISNEDNKEISVGKKRQILLEQAKGLFVVGFDSDDFPAPDYISEIVGALRACNDDIDHIGFLENCNIDGAISTSIFSIKYHKWAENAAGYDHIRCANPKSVIRREKALQVGFKDMRWGEDTVFSETVTPLLKGEIFIDKPLYNYIHKSSPYIERYGYDKD